MIGYTKALPSGERCQRWIDQRLSIVSGFGGESGCATSCASANILSSCTSTPAVRATATNPSRENATGLVPEAAKSLRGVPPARGTLKADDGRPIQLGVVHHVARQALRAANQFACGQPRHARTIGVHSERLGVVDSLGNAGKHNLSIRTCGDEPAYLNVPGIDRRHPLLLAIV